MQTSFISKPYGKLFYPFYETIVFAYSEAIVFSEKIVFLEKVSDEVGVNLISFEIFLFISQKGLI